MTALTHKVTTLAGFQPMAAMPSRLTKGSRRKGTVKLGRVPSAGLNEQSGLNCTGCVPPDVGRATTGSTMRQRNARLKPLYLHAQLPMVWWDGETIRPDPARLDVSSWRSRLTAIDDWLTFLASHPVPSGVERVI